MVISTSSQIFYLAADDPKASPASLYNGQGIQWVTEGTDLVAVAHESGEIFTIGADGSTTQVAQIEEPVECIHLRQEDPVQLLVGTEGPHIYSVNGGAERVGSFEELECRDSWYTPWGGPPAVRSFASTGDGWIYADIHVGSIMRSPDGGASWEPVTPDLHQDVHQVATSPVSDELLFANTADAVYTSQNRGNSWSHHPEGLPVRYGRAISVHPEDPSCLLASVSTGPGGSAEGKLFRTDDGGDSWSHVTEGFPEVTRGNIDTFHLAFSKNGTAWAISDEDLYRSSDRGRTWEVFWTAPESIRVIDCYIP